jgi:hypothetical protein
MMAFALGVDDLSDRAITSLQPTFRTLKCHSLPYLAS